MKSDAQLIIDRYMQRVSGINEAQEKLSSEKETLKSELQADLLDLANQTKMFRLVLDEWRDDSVSAFQVAQSVQVIITDVVVSDKLGVAIPKLEKLLFTKTGKVKFKHGKPDTRKINWNPFASWRVVDYLDQSVFGYSMPQVIRPDKYTEESLALIRERLSKVQAF